MANTYSNQPVNSVKAIFILVVFGLLIVGSIIYYFVHQHDSQGTDTAAIIKPPVEVISIAEKYLQARENSVGADQASPDSWLASIKPISTTSWWTSLQPNGDATGSSTSEDYRTAHDSGYVVKAAVANCVWDTAVLKQITDAGTVRCDLTDQTIKQSDGSEVDAQSLPFGWTRNGQQPAASLKVVNQNGTWLVDGETNGQSE